MLVGVSGITFCIALGLWQSLATRWPLQRLVVITFALEIALLLVVGLFTPACSTVAEQTPAQSASCTFAMPVFAAVCIGAANGFYNAFFWTTQRTLFLKQLGQNSTGRQYGNLQIFVSLFLKAGILIGGFLLDHGGFIWLLMLSAVTSAISASYLAWSCKSEKTLYEAARPTTLGQSLRFKDQYGSRSTFWIDGIFLYLESHFWTLSLFLVVQQDFSRLGIAVVLLAAIFALLFFVIKNRIDQMPVSVVFKLAVWLYAASWIMRLSLDKHSGESTLLIMLVVITFCSSFFRLAFNKHFFDVACQAQPVSYLLMKSYSSQFVLGVFFLLLGILLTAVPMQPQFALTLVYAGAALLSLIYLRYASDNGGIDPI